MDADSLRDSLRTKLNDLEARLEAHRQDLLGEFHQYYHGLTNGISTPVTTNIDLDDYKILRPSFPQHLPPPPAASQPTAATAAPPAESPPPPASETEAATFQTLSLASLTADSGGSDSPGSPRDRDHELQGLFTPSFLPLLAASPLHDAPVSTTAAATSEQPSAVAASNPQAAETGPLPAVPRDSTSDTTQASMDQISEEARFSRQLTTLPRHRPGESEAADAATADDANSSASSDKSDNKGPRSALRRSSSIYKSPQSPRRVRFEFMGAEVLPTASPQPSDTMMPRSSSPAWEGDDVTVDSILGDGDADDFGPPPRKISSSDKLRALSREPLEDGTVWTVVNADTDSSVTQKLQQVDLKESEEPHRPIMQEIRREPNEKMSAADDEAIAMKKTKQATSPLLGKTVTSPAPTTVSKSTPNSKGAAVESSTVDDDDDDDDDDMFQFEDEGGRTSSPKPPGPQVDDEESGAEDTAGTSALTTGLSVLRSPTSVVPTSVPVAKLELPEPTSPTTPRFHIGSVGSYKGRSIMMPVVKNPEVHARAASIGNFNSFVGGLDGTSGMDAADLSSYRASFMRDNTFNGTPRSFTERLMMEDMEEAERQKGKDEI